MHHDRINRLIGILNDYESYKNLSPEHQSYLSELESIDNIFTQEIQEIFDLK